MKSFGLRWHYVCTSNPRILAYVLVFRAEMPNMAPIKPFIAAALYAKALKKKVFS
jgi:hypothetical protein